MKFILLTILAGLVILGYLGASEIDLDFGTANPHFSFNTTPFRERVPEQKWRSRTTVSTTTTMEFCEKINAALNDWELYRDSEKNLCYTDNSTTICTPYRYTRICTP